MIHRKEKHLLKTHEKILTIVWKVRVMGRKKAVVTVELVDESAKESDERITQELLDWFKDDSNVVPWVKSVKRIVLQDD